MWRHVIQRVESLLRSSAHSSALAFNHKQRVGFLVALAVIMTRSSGTRAQRIPMTSVKALTLHADREITYRRTSAVPQLTCKGKTCRQYQPDVVQCTAVGEDGAGGLEWSCSAELPKGVRFGSVTVSCEGWNGPDDPYILKGSCGLEYNLVRAHSALEGDNDSFLPSRFRQSDTHPLVSLATLLLFLYALYRLVVALLPRLLAWFRSTGPGGRANGRSWYGGGGSGGGGPGGGGPPPPYTAKPTEGTSWRPGFWTGALAGALGGEAAARMRGQRGVQPGYGYTGAYRPAAGLRPNYGLREADDWDRGVGGSGSWGGGGGSSGAGMRSSTGFGGTRNR